MVSYPSVKLAKQFFVCREKGKSQRSIYRSVKLAEVYSLYVCWEKGKVQKLKDDITIGSSLFLFCIWSRMSVSKPITAKDLQDFSEALEKNPLLKYQMGSAGKLFIILTILKVPKREIFVTELIILSDPLWIGDLRTKAKNRFV
jgi:hypothetical protein